MDFTKIDSADDEQEEEDTEMNDSNDSETDSNESDSQELEVDISEINRLQEELSINAYDYEKHLQLIERLRTCGELELIRSAREKMSQIYPLTPKLWLEWINDEIKIASTPDEKNNILKLFERSVNDYLSPQLWLDYVQYSIGCMDSLGIEGVRRIFERALTSVGLHVSEGSLVWDTFREFESVILQTTHNTDDNQLNDEIKKQIDRIFDLFRRQLSVPLTGMENTYKECELWCNTMKDKYGIDLKFTTIKSVYEKAFNELQKLISYEESLISSEPPHLEQYLRYIEYETINGSPMRVQCIYERALTDNCLVSDLWLRYTNYQDKKVVVDSILIPIYERAVRNCPWSSSIWISYLKALERLKSDHQKTMNVFETALQSGFQQSEEYLQLWLTYLDYLRRKTNWKDDNDVKSLRKTFEKAIEHLSNIENGDPNCSLLQYWAKIEAKFCGKIETARDMWNNLLNSRSDIASQAQNWIEFSKLEQLFGDEKHYRKVLLRGLLSSSDWPESIGQILITYEREEGASIESYDEVIDKYESVIKKITEKRRIATEKEAEEKKQLKLQRKQDKYELKRASKRKNEDERQKDNEEHSKVNLDPDGFKVPQMTSSVSAAKKSKLETESRTSESLSKQSSQKQSTQSDVERGEHPSHGVTYRSDGSKDLQTIFVSNLDFKVNEQQIREAFEKFGKIDDLRLVRNYKGLSKGYCYIEYSSIESAREALKHDRMPLEGRPVFISEIGKRSKFSYSNSIEKNKLFVKNLSPSITSEDLKKIFEKYGSLKDTRIVTYRSGHSKGCAYVEYDDEVSAKEAVKQTDGLLVADMNIIVTISNPAAKSNTSSNKYEETASLGGGSTSSISSTGSENRRAKSRINAPMIPHALRVQRQTQNSANDAATSSSHSSNGGTPMSNKDFRSLLLGSK